jgi:CBS domain-containing protein
VKVKKVMRRSPKTCTPTTSLAKAVRRMRKHNFGFLPVLDDAHRLVGVVTDRDICLAAEQRDRPLSKIVVRGAMHTNLHTCRPEEDVSDVLALMTNYRVRRVPVVGSGGELQGVVTLSDLARMASRKGGPKPKAVVTTYAAIYEPRSAEHYA